MEYLNGGEQWLENSIGSQLGVIATTSMLAGVPSNPLEMKYCLAID